MENVLERRPKLKGREFKSFIQNNLSYLWQNEPLGEWLSGLNVSLTSVTILKDMGSNPDWEIIACNFRILNELSQTWSWPIFLFCSLQRQKFSIDYSGQYPHLRRRGPGFNSRLGELLKASFQTYFRIQINFNLVGKQRRRFSNSSGQCRRFSRSAKRRHAAPTFRRRRRRRRRHRCRRFCRRQLQAGWSCSATRTWAGAAQPPDLRRRLGCETVVPGSRCPRCRCLWVRFLCCNQ